MPRQTVGSSARPSRVTATIPYDPPLDWEHLLGWARGHQVEGMEKIGDGVYERPVRVDGRVGWLIVRHEAAGNRLRVELIGGEKSWLPGVVKRVRRMFDLDADMAMVEKLLSGHSVLGDLWKKTPGLRISRGWDPFETTITTILGQLVSVKQAKALARQLVVEHGETVIHPVTGETMHAFPEAKSLANAALSTVRTSEARKRCIREMARAVAAGELDLQAQVDFVTFKKRLLEMPGIGPWSAEYIALRALGDPDAMPSTDLVLKRVIRAIAKLDLEDFRPLRGYAAIYLWKHSALFKQVEDDVRVKEDKVAGGGADARRKRKGAGGGAVGKRSAGKGEVKRRGRG